MGWSEREVRTSGYRDEKEDVVKERNCNRRWIEDGQAKRNSSWRLKREKEITTGWVGKQSWETRKRQAKAKTKTILAMVRLSCMVISVCYMSRQTNVEVKILTLREVLMKRC